MDDPTADPPETPARRRTGKPEAVLDAARRVFGREGYPRASIGQIAREAEVSTRTIYNHFSGKDELFRRALQGSGEQVAAALEDRIARHLDDVPDDGVDDALRALGHEWVAPLAEFADHFAMVRQVGAEAQHIPPEVLDAWRTSGPERVERALADRLAELDRRGVLRAPDPGRTAVHFTLLVAGELNARSFHGAVPLEPEESRRCVDAGIDAFLAGHRAGR